MKLLITSVDAIIDNKTDDYFPGICEAISYFKTLNEDNACIVVSAHENKLQGLDEGIFSITC